MTSKSDEEENLRWIMSCVSDLLEPLVKAKELPSPIIAHVTISLVCLLLCDFVLLQVLDLCFKLPTRDYRTFDIYES